MFDASDFRGDPYGHITNQAGHFVLGEMAASVVLSMGIHWMWSAVLVVTRAPGGKASTAFFHRFSSSWRRLSRSARAARAD